MSVYGDTGRLALVGAAVQPTNTLIDIMREPGHWLVTLAPLRTAQGGRITAPVGVVTFTASAIIGHAGREAPLLVDWPTQGGTFAVCCSSLNLKAGFEGSIIVTAGNSSPDVVFTAWAARQSGPRQTIYPPPRTVPYGTIPATGSPAAIVRLPVPGWARAYTVQVGTQAAPTSGIIIARSYQQAPALSPVRTDEWGVAPATIAPGARVGLVQGLVVGNPQAPLRSVPLPPNTEWLELENAMAADQQAVVVVYDLDLG